jgi:hypothetical protein
MGSLIMQVSIVLHIHFSTSEADSRELLLLSMGALLLVRVIE